MAFAAADRFRLVKCLNLSRDQLKDNSRLAVLMTDLERFDTDNSTALVAEVREQLDLWEEVGETLPALQAQDGYKVVDVVNEVRVETHSAGASSATAQGQRRGYVAAILKYLDEYDQLQPFIMTGRVVRTL